MREIQDQDKTREQLLEELHKLRRVNQLFDVILQNESLCVSRIDEKGVVTESRGRGLNRLGHEENELVGKAIKLIHSEIREGRVVYFRA